MGSGASFETFMTWRRPGSVHCQKKWVSLQGLGLTAFKLWECSNKHSSKQDNHGQMVPRVWWLSSTTAAPLSVKGWANSSKQSSFFSQHWAPLHRDWSSITGRLTIPRTVDYLTEVWGSMPFAQIMQASCGFATLEGHTHPFWPQEAHLCGAQDSDVLA